MYQLLDYVFRVLIESAQAKGSLNVSVGNIINELSQCSCTFRALVRAESRSVLTAACKSSSLGWKNCL